MRGWLVRRGDNEGHPRSELPVRVPAPRGAILKNRSQRIQNTTGRPLFSVLRKRHTAPNIGRTEQEVLTSPTSSARPADSHDLH